MYVLLQNKDVILAHELLLENNGIFYKMNLPFWQLTIATRPRYKFKNKIDIVNYAVDNAMILPCNIEHDKTNNGFAIITENWKYMSHKKTLEMYKPAFNTLLNLNIPS